MTPWKYDPRQSWTVQITIDAVTDQRVYQAINVADGRTFRPRQSYDAAMADIHSIGEFHNFEKDNPK